MQGAEGFRCEDDGNIGKVICEVIVSVHICIIALQIQRILINALNTETSARVLALRHIKFAFLAVFATFRNICKVGEKGANFL